jgi:hypothetical protein
MILRCPCGGIVCNGLFGSSAGRCYCLNKIELMQVAGRLIVLFAARTEHGEVCSSDIQELYPSLTASACAHGRDVFWTATHSACVALLLVQAIQR